VKRIALLPLLLIILVPSTPGWADDPPSSGRPAGPPPGQADSLRWSLGLGVISSPRPYVGADNSLRVIPMLELYYKRLFVQGIRAGFRLAEWDSLKLNATAGPRFLGFEESDSPFLAGMADRDESIDVGLSLAWERRRHGAALWVRHDVANRSDGGQAGIDLFLRRAYGGGRFRLQPGLGIEWQSHETVDYYYGVRPEEERLPYRPAYAGGSTFNFAASFLGLYSATRRVNLVLMLRLKILGDEIADSPIVESDLSYFGLLGLSYRF
jgi:outer membrane protein